jgi:hypothetical protein
VIFRQRHEPERHLGKVYRYRVAVHAIEAALGHQPHREDQLVLVWRDGGHLPVGVPLVYEFVAELATSFDEERP